MKQTNTRRIFAVLLIAGFLITLAGESCNSEKKCGCGVDLYSRYKMKGRHR